MKNKIDNKPHTKIVSYLPHGINENKFFPIGDKSLLEETKKNIFGNKTFDFTIFFNSRNIRRKCTSDLLAAHKLFLDSFLRLAIFSKSAFFSSLISLFNCLTKG